MSTSQMRSDEAGKAWTAFYDEADETYSIGWKKPVGMRVVATVDCGYAAPIAKEQHAHARLIAAAPELLAIAKQYASECAACSGSGHWERVPNIAEPSAIVPCEDCEDVRAVIAKAEGSK